MGRPGVHWERLAQLLAEHQPETYAGVTGESVSALVRDHQVPSVGVKDAAGKVLKGCRYEAIKGAIERRQIGPGGG